eukprot:1191720-Prorocentrum_minimum.AAC.2
MYRQCVRVAFVSRSRDGAGATCTLRRGYPCGCGRALTVAFCVAPLSRPSPPLSSNHPPLSSTHPPLSSTQPPLSSTHTPLSSTHPPLSSTHPLYRPLTPSIIHTPPLSSTHPLYHPLTPLYRPLAPRAQALKHAHDDERFEYDEKLRLAAEHEAETVKKLQVGHRRILRGSRRGERAVWVEADGEEGNPTHPLWI